MKKLLLSCFLATLFLFSGITHIHADEYLRVGMEAAYAPFNWTQDDDSNGAVPIEGTNQYANGYDVQIAKKLQRDWIKTYRCQNNLDRFNSSFDLWKNRHDCCWNESN